MEQSFKNKVTADLAATNKHHETHTKTPLEQPNKTKKRTQTRCWFSCEQHEHRNVTNENFIRKTNLQTHIFLLQQFFPKKNNL